MATNYKDYIDSLYNPQKTAVQSSYDATAADLSAKKAGAGQLYQPQINDAYTTQQMMQRINAENIANMGYSAGGQTSQSLGQRATNNLLTTKSNVNRDQQAYINSIDSELRNAGVTRDTAFAQVEADRGSALLNQQNTVMSQAMQLYGNKMISAAQFEQMTGVKPQSLSTGGSDGGTINVNGERMTQTQYANYLRALAKMPTIASQKEKAGMSIYL